MIANRNATTEAPPDLFERDRFAATTTALAKTALAEGDDLFGSDAGAPAPPTGAPAVEGYRVVALLGRGGMGSVWRAVQLSTRREVALKLLNPGSAASDKAHARFDREVELAARLEHPNLARVYDSGVDRGVYFYAMELIDGAHLDAYVASARLGKRQILALMRTVCRAVQHAH